MVFKDLFSGQAADYAKFRPRYPAKLFDFLASVAPSHERVWDCGTGNGQAAVELARRFDSVIATDPSEKQLASAEPHPRVQYVRASAEQSPLAAQSVDLVTVAQAFHWFRQDEFFSEARRVLKPRGILAIWTYNLPRISPEVDQVVDSLYRGTLDGYWEKARRLVEEGYRNVSFPFDEIQTPAFEMTAEWTVEQFFGYLSTWSALNTYIRKNRRNPLTEIAPRLESAWQGARENQGMRTVRWEFALRVGWS